MIFLLTIFFFQKRFRQDLEHQDWIYITIITWTQRQRALSPIL